MATFADVMRQWVRARKATRSSDSENVLSVYPLEMYDDNLIATIEKRVMQWAAEHPEPVYPTWGDWLAEQDVVIKDKIGEEYKYNTLRKITKPIPADIAEKLGIKPIR